MVNQMMAYSLGFLVVYKLMNKEYSIREIALADTTAFLAILGTIQLLIDKMGG